MTVSFAQIESILNTLPIGYYIGRNVPVKLTEEEGSYYNLADDNINLSYPMVDNALKTISKTIDEKELESIIRTLLYHEVSHAFLTPKLLRITDIMNVFEDERIERLCDNYYRDVDFTKLLMLVNNWDGKTNEAPKSAFEAWYQLVRYHVGKKKFLDEVQCIIETYSEYNRNERYVSDYEHDVLQLYRKIEQDFLDNQKKAEENKQDDDGTQTDEQKNEQSEEQNNEQSADGEDGKKEIGENGQPDEEITDLDRENFKKSFIAGPEETKELFAKAQKYFNNDIIEKFRNIILTHKKIAKTSGSAINSYSGVFDPRSVARDDYKWFVQQNRMGNIKQFSKLKLNLFIDNSGSFRDNETLVNQMLLALKKIEKQDPNFSFDLVTLNTKCILHKKDDRLLFCQGGNIIPDYTKDIITKVQDRHSMNYNIVLFDGDAFSDIRYNNTACRKSNIGFFNMPNTVMILDNENYEYAERYCKNVRKTYTRAYTKELLREVCSALNFLFK